MRYVHQARSCKRHPCRERERERETHSVVVGANDYHHQYHQYHHYHISIHICARSRYFGLIFVFSMFACSAHLSLAFLSHSHRCSDACAVYTFLSVSSVHTLRCYARTSSRLLSSKSSRTSTSGSARAPSICRGRRQPTIVAATSLCDRSSGRRVPRAT